MNVEICTNLCTGDERILIATLDRPKQRNAMSVGLVERLLALLDEVAGNSARGAIVITGTGRGFCAGSDLAGLAAMEPAARSAFEAASGKLSRRIACHPLPILAAVHGFAIGGGLTLAAACDIVATTADAKWSLPEVPIGLFPAWGLEAVLDRVGRPMARRLAWGIDTVDGESACELGLADVVADDPLQAAVGLARRLADLPRSQSAAVKNYFATLRSGEEADDHANRLFMAACATAEAKTTLSRFAS
jgi:enoyl-CoA hydratase/carnithine racemase